MPEFYKYAERQAGSQINWAGIGVDLAKTLAETERIREQKRVEIDDATNKTLTELANMPKGEAPNGNRLISEYSDDVSKALLMQHRLLKSGRLPPKDYMLFNANVKSGTDQMLNLQKQYQNQYSVTMDRSKTGKSQDAEVDLKAYYESFADLSKMKPIIDPKTGQINLAIMEYDSNNVLQPTGKVVSVQSAFKGLDQKFDKFNVGEASESVSKKLAPVIKTLISEGSMSERGKATTIDYALQDPNTVKALDNYAESYLENPYNLSSVLTNDLGTYENDFSQSGKSDGTKLVWEVDNYGTWKPKPTEQQKKDAKEFLLTQFKANIANKEDIKTFESQSLDAYNARTARQNAATSAKNAQTRNFKASGNGADEGPGWVDYVTQRVPNVQDIVRNFGAKGMVDENVIEQLTNNFQGFGLNFQQGPGTAGESIVIVDNDFEPPKTSLPIKLSKNPNAQQEIIDYIVTNKANVGKDLVATGVTKKNVKGQPATKSTYKGLDADGNPIFE